ncbi:MAG: 4-hydroxy-tetrahydrodipicolinate synthase [Spirochaetales bacterium]|nr:4-hydroxy-tetrahydrodipicolinate synthase [Spirochaetales bacterium]
MNLAGVHTALVTPMNRDGSIDEKALRDLVDFQVAAGISGLVPVGTTGECPTLSHEEHHRVIDIVIDQANKRVPVIAGTGSNSTKEAIDLTKHAKASGADVSLQVAPYYNKPSQEGFYRHFMAVVEAVDLPIIVYNIQGRTGKNIENSTMLKLAAHPRVIGVKEASGSIPQVMDLVSEKPDSFDILSGDDNLTLPIIAVGGIGVVSVASNLIPGEMLELVQAALAGEMDKAREIHYRFLSLFKAEFIDTNPIPIKYMCALKGMMEENYRLPLCSMDETLKKKVQETLRTLKLI